MSGPYFPGYVVKGDVSDITTDARHELGRLTFDKGRILQYVKFGAGAARYSWVGLDITATAGVDAAHTAWILTPNSTHQPLGVAEYGGTASSYGWITRFGGATAKVASTVALGVGVTNAGSVTGALATLQSATILQALRSHGIVVAVPNATGHAQINVNCL